MSVIATLRSVLKFREYERDSNLRRLGRTASIEDLRRVARRRLPRGVFDYIDGGAEDERTLSENAAAFGRIGFRPRVLRDVDSIDTSTRVLGTEAPLPLILSPTGFTRIVEPPGELTVARAAAKADLPYTLSTLSTRSIEEVAAAAPDGRRWFQVYVWRDRGLVKEMLSRAKEAGYEAIMITVDTAVLGRRERDVRRGFSLPPKIGLSTLIDGALHPAWTVAFSRSEPIVFANLTSGTGGHDAVSLAEYVNSQFDSGLSWGDIEWFRSNWDGPIILKGVATTEDAAIAVDHEIEAIALSNHGGRQLDGAPAPIDLVAPVVDTVAGKAEIYCDGGVRRGSDIAKAVALGATACMIGRPYLFGLAAGSGAGVTHVINHFHEGLRRTMALLGATNCNELTPELVSRQS